MIRRMRVRKPAKVGGVVAKKSGVIHVYNDEFKVGETVVVMTKKEFDCMMDISTRMFKSLYKVNELTYNLIMETMEEG